MKPDAPAEIRALQADLDKSRRAADLRDPTADRIDRRQDCARAICFHRGAAVHDAGWQIMQMGEFSQCGINTPHVGSAVWYLRGPRGDLPSHVVLPETMGRGGGNLTDKPVAFWVKLSILRIDGRSIEREL